MLDMKWIRHNPQALDEALGKRHCEPQSSAILFADQKRRSLLSKLEGVQAHRHALSREIGKALEGGDLVRGEMLKQEVSQLKASLSVLEDEKRNLTQILEDMLLSLPNLPLEDVPFGRNKADNIEIRRFNVSRSFDFIPKQHYILGDFLGGMDFDRATRMSGARFAVLFGELACLERAIGQFMIDLHTREHGYREVAPPFLVRTKAVVGTAQLPRFSDDLFKTLDDRWLIPTGEVPLTNLVQEEMVHSSSLPLRFTALTPCFRSEAGSAGRDTRGMLRQHQFWKVEMVSITDLQSSQEELERMTLCAEEVLKRLELPFRTVLLCTGDMGFSACKTYDIEVWLPGKEQYIEISSCSLCGEFQARRMNARYFDEGEKDIHFVQTLNGSGLAVGRCLIAVMENYQQADGRIAVPDSLRPYMGGLEMIGDSR
ncbi:MAG: seryl-tRNA synthetase [Candidatus Tokpelaia sp. JSC161]|jgi:seryl-tRNA synthetase|nr:MAG: seryl-tRNA synthetase [Candidatus Tokpelaia sp. JSC161]